MFQHENPRIVKKLKIDDENKFEYLFLALVPYIFCFASRCRHVIFIDGTHLKEKYRGAMFVSPTMNGNEQNFPLVFGFGNGENDQSWT